MLLGATVEQKSFYLDKIRFSKFKCIVHLQILPHPLTPAINIEKGWMNRMSYTILPKKSYNVKDDSLRCNLKKYNQQLCLGQD